MAPTINYPGVYVEEVPRGPRAIVGVATSITVFVGRMSCKPSDANGPVSVTAFVDYTGQFGELDLAYPMGYAVRDFFTNGGSQALIIGVGSSDGTLLTDADYIGDIDAATGLHALRKVALFNLLCLPPDTRDGGVSPVVCQAALALCVEARAMLVLDAPAHWSDAAAITCDDHAALDALGISGDAARNAALYFPRLVQGDPLCSAQSLSFAACGAVAGVMARTDATQGVWKAPAGIAATLNGVAGLAVQVSDFENGLINSLGVNGLRTFVGHDPVVWGARTLAGRDSRADEYRYLSVRRLALHIEQSVLHGTQWAAFERNDEALWAQLRSSVGAFLHELFLRGAFRGGTSRDAWFVQCDATSMNQDDLDRGVATITVGFAAQRPAEFVVVQLAVLTASAEAGQDGPNEG